MQVFMVRGGKLLGQEHFILDGTGEEGESELFSEFLKQFYTARSGNAGFGSEIDAELAGSPLALRAARDKSRRSQSRNARAAGRAERRPRSPKKFCSKRCPRTDRSSSCG